eukprot:c16847_g1_i1.p1 GENE.c16847_g1_i1~~c16847_g1_i1.p1  ORF type:complete len:831 (+),score=175.00 c16847_g1_i1:609-3101(+)
MKPSQPTRTFSIFFSAVYGNPEPKSATPLLTWLKQMLPPALACLTPLTESLSLEAKLGDWAPNILVQIWEFFRSTQNIPKEAVKLVTELLTVQNKPQIQNRIQTASRLSVFDSLDVHSVDCTEMAISLTIISSRVFREINFRQELINRKVSPGLDHAHQHFNAVSDFVQKSILESTGPHEAVGKFDFWLNVALICTKHYRNFCDAIAINAAIQATPVYRLRRISELVQNLPVYAKWSRDCLGRLDAKRRDVYFRFVLQSVTPLIPFLGCFQSALVYVNEMPDRYRNQPLVINFEKRRKISNMIRMLTEYQSKCVYDDVPTPHLVAQLELFLDQSLRPSDAQLMRMSYELEPDPSDLRTLSAIPRTLMLDPSRPLESPLLLGDLSVQMSVQDLMTELFASEVEYVKSLRQIVECKQYLKFLCTQSELITVFHCCSVLHEAHEALSGRLNTVTFELDEVCKCITQFLELAPKYVKYIESYNHMLVTLDKKMQDVSFKNSHNAFMRSLTLAQQEPLMLADLLVLPKDRMHQSYLITARSLVRVAKQRSEGIDKMKRLAVEAEHKITRAIESCLPHHQIIKAASLFAEESPCLLYNVMERSNRGEFKKYHFALFESKIVAKSSEGSFEMTLNTLVQVDHKSELRFDIYHAESSFQVRAPSKTVAQSWVKHLRDAIKRFEHDDALVSAPLASTKQDVCNNCEERMKIFGVSYKVPYWCQRCGGCICEACHYKSVCANALSCKERQLSACRTLQAKTRRESNVSVNAERPSEGEITMADEAKTAKFVNLILKKDYDAAFLELEVFREDQQQMLKAAFKALVGDQSTEGESAFLFEE